MIIAREMMRIAKLSLKQTLVIVWVGILVLVVIGTVFIYQIDKRQSIEALRCNVEGNSLVKVKQVVEWHKDRTADAQMFAQSPFFRDAIYSWLTQPDREDLRGDIEKRLNLVNINKTYSSVLITNIKGDVLFNIGDTIDKPDISTRIHIREAVRDKRIVFTNLYKCSTHGTLHIDYIAPVIAKSDSVFAVILFRVNPFHRLYPIVEEWPGSVGSEHDYVVVYNGDTIVFLNSIWWAKDIYSDIESFLRISQKQLADALYHIGEFIEVNNIKGESKFIHTSQVGDTSWKLVKIIDEGEVHKYMGTNLLILILIPLLIIALVSIVLISYWYGVKKNEFLRVIAKERKLSGYYKEFQTIFYSIGDGVIITDVNGFVTNMNFEAVKLTGYRESEAFCKSIGSIFKIIQKKTRISVENPVHTVIRLNGQVNISDNILLVNRHNHDIPISSNAAPIYNDKEELQGVVLVFRDKTSEYESARKIKESEDSFRIIMGSISDGLWDWNIKTDKTYFSPAYYTMLGYEVDDFPASPDSWRKLLHPDDFRSATTVFLKCINGEFDCFESEFRLKAKDGSWHWILGRGKTITRDKKGKALRMVGTNIDITERKLIEQNLKDSESKLNLALKVAKMGYWKYSIASKRIEWFGGLKNLFGYTLQNFSGTIQEVKDIIHSEDRRSCVLDLLNTVKFETPFDNTVRINSKSGMSKWFHSYGYLYKLNGRPDHIFGVTQDITEQKISEETLRLSEEKYRVLFNNMTQAFALHDIILDETGIPIDYRFIDVNDSFEILTGLDAETVVGRSVKEMMPDVEQYWIDIYGKVAITGEPIRYENYSEELGKFYDVWAFSPKKGQFATIFSDITHKKKTEETLQKLTKGIEQSPVEVVITDIKGRIEYVNPRFVEVTGFSATEVMGKNSRIVNSGNHSKEFFKDLWDTILGGNDWKGEILNRKKMDNCTGSLFIYRRQRMIKAK